MKSSTKDLIKQLEKFIARSTRKARLYKELWKAHLKEAPGDILFAEQLHHHMRIHELDIKMDKETLKMLKRKKSKK